jgi:DNA-binding NarL/FixJ family response regulator
VGAVLPGVKDVNANMNLLVMDDAASIRERIVELLSEIQGIDEILESGDAASAVKLISEKQPGVVILDIQVPPSGPLRNGIDVLKLTKLQFPKTGVIVLTNFANPRYRDECTRLGADFFFDKSSEFEQVPEAVMTIMRRAANVDGAALGAE